MANESREILPMATDRVNYPIYLHKPVPVALRIGEEDANMIGLFNRDMTIINDIIQIPIIPQESVRDFDGLLEELIVRRVLTTVLFKVFILQMSYTCRVFALEYLSGPVDELGLFRRFDD